MEQKSEQINLEYMVKFEDGLRPKVHIYGINSEAGEVYGADARIGVSVGAGYHVVQPSKEDFENKHTLAMVEMGSKLDTSLVVDEFRGKLPEDENWEQEVYDIFREDGANVIRVQNPNHIRTALDRHAKLYREQFHDLAKRFTNLFQGFIGEHPGFGKY